MGTLWAHLGAIGNIGMLNAIITAPFVKACKVVLNSE